MVTKHGSVSFTAVCIELQYIYDAGMWTVGADDARMRRIGGATVTSRDARRRKK